jgi:hypothetical protein
MGDAADRLRGDWVCGEREKFAHMVSVAPGPERTRRGKGVIVWGNAPLADATNSRDVRSTSLPLEYAWSIRHVVAGHRTGATKVFGPRFDRDRRSADRSYRVRRLPIDDGPEF